MYSYSSTKYSDQDIDRYSQIPIYIYVACFSQAKEAKHSFLTFLLFLAFLPFLCPSSSYCPSLSDYLSLMLGAKIPDRCLLKAGLSISSKRRSQAHWVTQQEASQVSVRLYWRLSFKCYTYDVIIDSQCVIWGSKHSSLGKYGHHSDHEMKRKLWSFSSQTEGQKQEVIGLVCFQSRVTANCPEHTCIDTHTHSLSHTHTCTHTDLDNWEHWPMPSAGSTSSCGPHGPSQQTESPCADPVPCVALSKPDSTSPPRNQGPGPWFSAQSFIWELIRNAKSHS